MKNPEMRKTEPSELVDIIKNIENYYENIVEEEGFLGYCVGCDSLTYIIGQEYVEGDKDNFVPVKTGDLECLFCETEENNLFFASTNDIFGIYGIFRGKTPEKITYLIDNWREKNSFPNELDYEFNEGLNLVESFENWDSLRNSEKYEQSANLLIEQYRKLPSSRLKHLFKNKERQVFYNTDVSMKHGQNNNK